MKFWKDNVAALSTLSVIHLWWIPAVVPLIMVFSSFVTGTWSWGLMDDLGMVQNPGNVWERFVALLTALLADGRFYPTSVLHFALFYKIFQSNPHAFFFFRFFEVIVALSIWGYLANEVTHKKSAAPLFFAITLAFYRFYDAFFFLSTTEILGILFSGAGVLCFVKALKPSWDKAQEIKWSFLILGSSLLLFAFMSKEPFVSVGAALGLSLIAIWLKDRRIKQMARIGIVLLFVSIVYALWLKVFVVRGYSASYSLGWAKISGNIVDWFRYIVVEHLPWIALVILSMFWGAKDEKRHTQLIWGRSFGILAYILYLLLILPWSAGGHYVTPLAVFFGFTVTVWLVNKLEKMRTAIVVVLILLSLGFNVFVGGRAIHFHATYQQDTASLVKWLAQNALFQHEVMVEQVGVRCNANEPCSTIPAMTNNVYGTSYSNFKFTPKVGDILKDENTKYYIWSPGWGDQDLRRLKNMWTTMFVSEHWYVFRRMF